MRYLLLIVYCFLFCPFIVNAQKKAGTTLHSLNITGFAHGFKDSSWLYLDDASSFGNAIDSAMVLNERFFLKTEKSLAEKYKRYAIRTKSFSDYKFFWMENQSLIFSGVKGNFKHSLIIGSDFQHYVEAFERLTMPLVLEIDSLRRNWGNTDSVVWKRILSLENELKEKSREFVAANITSTASAYLLSVYCKEWGRIASRELYHKMPIANRETEFGLAVKKFIELNREIEVGSTFVDFQQPSPDGVPIPLSSLAGNYILLEFWASWCGPCRRENPNIVALYNKYKDRGFQVFGVSHDVSASAWKKAIADDRLTWPNVSLLKGAENDAALIYGIFEIPTNFLIDPSGNIIAKNLRGEQLSKRLKELLGE